MEFLTEVTEEHLTKLKDRYYKFGSAELKVGDKISFIMTENISENGDHSVTLRAGVLDSDKFFYLLSDKK